MLSVDIFEQENKGCIEKLLEVKSAEEKVHILSHPNASMTKKILYLLKREKIIWMLGE